MYVLVNDGAIPTKYYSEKIELVGNIIIAEGIEYECTIEGEGPDMEVYISENDYRSILSRQTMDVHEKNIDTVFTDLLKGSEKLESDLNYTWKKDGESIIIYIKSSGFIRFYDTTFWNKLEYLDDERKKVRSLIKAIVSNKLGIHNVKVEVPYKNPDNHPKAINQRQDNNKPILNKKQQIQSLDDRAELLFDEMTKDYVEKTNSKYNNFQFWFDDKKCVIIYDKKNRLISFRHEFIWGKFEPMFSNDFHKIKRCLIKLAKKRFKIKKIKELISKPQPFYVYEEFFNSYQENTIQTQVATKVANAVNTKKTTIDDIENIFVNLMVGTTKKEDKTKFPDRSLWMKDNRCYFLHYRKDRSLYVSYHLLWKHFEKHFGHTYSRVSDFIIQMVKKYYHLDNITSASYAQPSYFEHYEKHFRPQIKTITNLNSVETAIYDFISGHVSSHSNTIKISWTNHNIKLDYNKQSKQVYYTEKFENLFPTVERNQLKEITKQIIENNFV